MRSFSLNILS